MSILRGYDVMTATWEARPGPCMATDPGIEIVTWLGQGRGGEEGQEEEERGLEKVLKACGLHVLCGVCLLGKALC